MSDAQAGTTPTTPDGSTAGTPGTSGNDSELNAQQKSEWMALKQKAEQFNRMEQDLAASQARAQELERIAYGGGARQATDPRAALVAQAQEQSSYDPVAQLSVQNARENMEIKAELWLANEIQNVPAAKRDQVRALVRNAGYQMSTDYALNLVTDHESKSMAEQLAAAQTEINRLKGARPNGVSPASALPATVSADDGRIRETIKKSDYIAALKQGGDAARALMQAVGSNATRLIND